MIELIQMPEGLRISRISNDEELIACIAYCVKVSGLNNPMSASDKHLFLIKVKEFYGYLQPNELRLAFDFALQGLTQCDTRHFQNFSIAYFTQIVNAYLDFRNKEVAKVATKTPSNEMVIKTDIEKEQIQKEYDEQIVRPIFDRYKSYGVVQIETTLPKMVYNSLVEHHKIITFTSEEKQKIYAECEKKWEARKEEVKKSRVSSLKEYKDRKSFLAAIEKPQGHKAEVLDIVYYFCIEEAFKRMIEHNIEI